MVVLPLMNIIQANAKDPSTIDHYNMEIELHMKLIKYLNQT